MRRLRAGRRLLRVSLGLVAVFSLGSLGAGPALAADPVFVGAGDIASCTGSGDSATAALVAKIPGTVFTAGDNAYSSGTSAEFANCYSPTWGAFKRRTRPSPGNHDYETSGASGYFGYFGSRAGNPSRGYYAYNLGTWRIYSLNSNCGQVGGCGRGSPQRRWLQADLARYPHRCVLAYWHHPLFSSGSHGNNPATYPFWRDLYAAHAEIIITGHDHTYERFRRQSPTGAYTPAGIQEFVVGTGGRSHYSWGTIKPNSAARNNDTFGVLKLTLHVSSWDWKFVPEAGKTFTDHGSTTCH